MVSMNAINIEVFQVTVFYIYKLLGKVSLLSEFKRTLAEYGAAATNASLATSTPTPQTMDSIMASSSSSSAAAPPLPPLSAVPPHLQAQYHTTTPPSVSQTPPYGHYPHQANGQQQDSHSHSYTSTMNDHGGYGQQQQLGYAAGQYQQQQQQPSAYPGYPPQPTYSGQTPTPAPTNLTDALASIPDEQKVRIYIPSFRGPCEKRVVCRFMSLIVFLFHFQFCRHSSCACWL
jgi:cleavage stimulation factor subunit 2